MPRFLTVLNALASATCLAAFVSRPSGSRMYMAGMAVAAVVALVSIAAAIRPQLANRWSGRAGFGVRGRFWLSVLPWLALGGLVLVTAPWWSQQAAPARLFGGYLLFAWSAGWVTWGRVPPADGEPPDVRMPRVILTAGAVFLGLLALNGLALGLSTFGVVVSAAAGAWAAAILAVAWWGSRASRDRWLTMSFGIALGFVAVEGGIRLMRLGDSLAEVDDPEFVRQFHHITPPNSAYLARPKPLDEFGPVLVETNAFGVRGPEIPAGRTDLLLIGDSMIEARQLPYEQTLGAFLPEAFRARGAADVRTVAHGVRGWSPLLEWNWYLKVGRKLEPRVVLLFFFWNDLWTAGDEVTTFRAVMGPDGRPDYFDVAVESDAVWFKHVMSLRLAENMAQRVGPGAVRRTLSMIGTDTSGLDLAAAQETAKRMAGDAALSDDEIDLLLTRPIDELPPRLAQTSRLEFWPSSRPYELWTPAQREAAARTEQKLKMFAEDVATGGGRLVIVHVPNAYQIAPTECSVARHLMGLGSDRLLPEPSGIQTWLREITARHGIELLDPTSAMREYHQTPSREPLYLRADCHWAERGHRFMADFVADWYLRNR